jgi:hypothetical protein
MAIEELFVLYRLAPKASKAIRKASRGDFSGNRAG